MKSNVWARLKATNLWQAAFVRPFEDQLNWKKLMAVWLSYGFGLLFVIAPTSMLIDDALSWPVPLDQMQKTSGRLSSVVIQRRGPSYLVVEIPDGSEKRFFARSLRRAALTNRVGNRVTIWSQVGFELFYGRIQEARELQFDGTDSYVLLYEESMPRRIQKDEQDQYWFLAMMTLGLIMIALPVWKHFKSG